MSKSTIFVVSAFLLSCAGAAVSYLIGDRSLGNWVAAPALVLSGWAALGHLVTLDEAMPGEWSNPQRSRALWHRSLTDLALKLLVFSGLVGFVISRQ
jgi:hypothetical protein